MLRWQTRFEEAAEAYSSMRAVAEAAGDSVAQVYAWEGLCWVQQAQGEYRAMLESAVRAEEVARRAAAGAKDALARALWIKGSALNFLGEAEEALSLGEQALALSTELDDRRLTASILNLLGWGHRALGEYEGAARYFEEALTLFHELGDQMGVAAILNDLGVIASSREDYAKATTLLEEALETARELGHRSGELVVLSNLGEAQVGLGAYQEAEAGLRQVIEISESVGWSDLSETYRLLAQAYLGQRRAAQALDAAQQALALGRETEAPDYIGAAWRVLGMVLAASESPESFTVDEEAWDAAGCFETSLQMLVEAGMEGEQARTLRAWAGYEMEQGDRELGERMARQAEEIFARLGV
jgi:tetratricopeptide (TPR) repeat protein